MHAWATAGWGPKVSVHGLGVPAHSSTSTHADVESRLVYPGAQSSHASPEYPAKHSHAPPAHSPWVPHVTPAHGSDTPHVISTEFQEGRAPPAPATHVGVAVSWTVPSRQLTVIGLSTLHPEPPHPVISALVRTNSAREQWCTTQVGDSGQAPDGPQRRSCEPLNR